MRKKYTLQKKIAKKLKYGLRPSVRPKNDASESKSINFHLSRALSLLRLFLCVQHSLFPVQGLVKVLVRLPEAAFEQLGSHHREADNSVYVTLSLHGCILTSGAN